MERSVHDNLIASYVVDCLNRTLTLYTIFQDREPWEYTDVKFSGVLAHHFEHVLEQNILFDVIEVPTNEVVEANQSLFAESWRHCWPEVEYEGDLQRLNEELVKNMIKGYVVQGSFGCHGWVLAEKCERVVGNAARSVTSG